jgi:hypothetical protein
MRYREILESKETLELPDIEVGDEVLVGKFKNRKAVVKGFDKDEHNQPVLKTNKGDQKLFKPRISKLEEGPLDDYRNFKSSFNDPKIDKNVHQQAARKNPAWKRSLVKTMKNYGFDLIGSGINGAVFSHPAYSYVLKVYRNDQGYDEFVHFMLSNKGNKYVPKIKGNPLRINSIFKAVRLETLVPCPTDKAVEFCEKMEQIDSAPWRDKDAIAGDPDLAKLSKFISNWEPHADVTPHNLMMRSNGQIVMIDPLYIDPSYEGDW